VTRALPVAESVTLAGAAGTLEAVLETPAGVTAPAACMVICHPHPLHGGTMHNKVVTTLARTAHELGVPTLRFNFRGVGASEGAFDDARGEVDDALAAVAWARQRWPGAALWLGGFSFGGVVALRASTTRGVGKLDALVTVAPALGRYYGAAREIATPTCPWLIVQGDADDVVDPAIISGWVPELAPPPQLAVLPGVGHFFHGQLPALQQQVASFLGARLP
jgi:alpha/beta superfamily hydrolase